MQAELAEWTAGGPVARAVSGRGASDGGGTAGGNWSVRHDAALSLVAGFPIRIVVRRREFHEPVEVGERQAYPQSD